MLWQFTWFYSDLTTRPLARKLWLPLDFSSTNERIPSSMKADLPLKIVCLTKTSICQSCLRLFFPPSRSPPSGSRCLSSRWEPLQKGSLCSRCRSTGGKHVFQISLYVSPSAFFLSLPLTHAHIIFHINAEIEKFNLALSFLCPATFFRQETSQKVRALKS